MHICRAWIGQAKKSMLVFLCVCALGGGGVMCVCVHAYIKYIKKANKKALILIEKMFH